MKVVQHAGHVRRSVGPLVLKYPKVVVTVTEIKAVVEFIDHLKTQGVTPEVNSLVYIAGAHTHVD